MLSNNKSNATISTPYKVVSFTKRANESQERLTDEIEATKQHPRWVALELETVPELSQADGKAHEPIFFR